ncbi:MAG: putative heme-binding domain-containing protein, partial [Candidatus Paceibacteria bacterium]
AQNRNIALYNAAGKQVAADRGVRFVDVFQPMQAIYEANPMNLSINGIHLNSAGNRELAGVIDSAIFGPDDSTTPGWVNDSVLATIIEKNLLWFNRYRVTDGYNVYGGRSRKVYNGAADGVPYANFEVLQRELDHIDGLVAARDRKIWDLVNGREHTPDLSDVLPLMPVATNKQGGGSGGSHIYLDPESSEGKITTAEGMRVEIFADERQFPELVNPVQMAWDTRGRLWVATWQTYPHWTVGQPMNDKLIILEDTNGDGYADKSTIFADNLHNPTGFEFWNGGVLLGAAPNLLFLRDTDGDDHVDETEILLHGLSSADTHHGANSFVIGPGGGLYFQEGTFHQSQVESIHGPVRNRNGCVWRFNPRTWTVERYIPYNYANPHGHVFDRWGQDFMTDGTGNVNYYSLPFSGYLPEPMKHSSYFAFFPQRSRPAGGTEILSSRHFPDEMQGNYLIANVIGFRGIFNYKVKDDHSGFGADEQEPLVESTELNFRPVDLEVGPDGAVYFLDWHNAIIGHLQHHLRDPSRDNAHGRVYRVTYEGRDLLEPAKIAGESIEHLIDLLKSPEDRTRYRSRLELSGRDSLQVVHATAKWVEQLDENDPQHEHNLLEALWLLQQHNQMDGELLQRVLDSPDPRARAAATRVVRYSRHLLPNALDLIGTSVLDENPRVRLEAVVAASFFRGAAAATIALEALRQPTDKFLTYALKETMRALEQDWKAALRAGETIAEGNPAGIEFLLGRVSSEELVHLPRVPAVLEALLTRAGVDVATRLSAADELASLRKTSITEEVLAAIKTVDQSGGGQATLVLKQLGGLLRQLSVSSPGPSREQLLDLAENSQRVATRAMGYAALIELERSNVAAWASAGESSARLLGLLQSTQWLTDSTLRADMVARIRPLMFAPPEGVSVASPGTGLDVAFYEPSPPNARRETLSSLSPTEEVWSDHFQLNLAPALESDSFGLAFSGVLFAPRDGTYTFSTNSDDGSRLYIGERSVVENDGPHGMVSRSGEIFLSKGPHPILVTFFESGGGQGLQVHWSGPGVERQLIPASVLGTGIGGKIQESAVRAMAFAPGSGDQKLTDAAELIEQGISWEACLQLMASGASVLHGSEAATRALEVMLPRLAALPAEERTGADMESVLELCRSLASGLPSDAQASYLARLGQLGGTRIEIATLPHQMLYDLDEFWVQAGRPVTIEFTNNDVMPHNLVVTIPGAMELVGQAAEALGGSGQGANQFVPETPSVLWFTSLVLPGQTESLTFTAPSELGDHPYVCTYPGHWRVMNGVMHVIAPGEEGGAIARRSSDLSHVEPRAFVQDWTLADLEPILEQGWLAQASYDRGEKLFAATGCINCHTVGCEGQGAGPDLIDVGQKYEPGMLLRHIFEPSLEVLEDYSFYIFEVEGQSDVIGRIVEDDGKNLHILQTLLEPDSLIQIEKAKIIERFDTGLSPMPTGLLVTLTKDEIRDLVSYVMNPRPMEEEEHGALEVSSAPEDPWIVFEGGDGPGKGKHVVLIAGDEEYRSEEALPMLARILSQRHGFRCTVLFSTDKENGEINPEEQTYIPGIEVLDDADMMVCFLRFRELPDE